MTPPAEIPETLLLSTATLILIFFMNFFEVLLRCSYAKYTFCRKVALEVESCRAQVSSRVSYPGLTHQKGSSAHQTESSAPRLSEQI